MKLELPCTPRYVWPVVVALLILDAVVVVGVGLALYRTTKQVHAFQMPGLDCRSFGPTILGDFYVIARCTRAAAPGGEEHQ